MATAMAPGTCAPLNTINIKWDPIARRLLFVGGDHGDRPKFVTYSEATNTWQELPQQPWRRPTSPR